MKDKALYYGKLACDTMMNKFQAAELPPKGKFHYHQGVFLSGMMNIYDLCGNEKYYDYVKEWVDSIVTEPGVINYFLKGALDDYMAGILLFPLYERTGEEKYMAALQLLMGNLKNWVKNEKGGFWHTEWTPHQMWLDGLYMAGPLQAIYSARFGDDGFIKEAVNQSIIMYDNMRDKATGLLYHAWDSSKEKQWADKETGLSGEFWGRSLGWYVVAVLDILENVPKETMDYQTLADIERELLTAIIRFQSMDDSLWYQVIDKGACSDNWQETSCSCLFVYAIAKAVRMRILSCEVFECAEKGFESILKKFVVVNKGCLYLSGVCIGTGVNDYQGYINRATSINDLHGMGAFLLMCAELAR